MFGGIPGGGVSYAEYTDGVMAGLVQIFGVEMYFLADQLGFGHPNDMILERGFDVIDEFVDFETVTYESESENFNAKVHPIDHGSHDGEYLVIVRSNETGRVVAMEVGATEDEAKAKAEQKLKEAESAQRQTSSGVIPLPNGCGDGQPIRGFGC